jgi:hypothetical protein
MSSTIQSTFVHTQDKRFAVDTTFVLFFLAVDFGQALQHTGIDAVLSLVTLGMLLVLPYFLPFEGERPDFTGWILGRGLIAVFATILGIMYGRSVGILLPETFRFLPMTLVILTALASCYLQFCAMIKFRLAR